MLKINSGLGLTKKTPDFAPEIDVLLEPPDTNCSGAGCTDRQAGLKEKVGFGERGGVRED
jgi:hypothetical protein